MSRIPNSDYNETPCNPIQKAGKNWRASRELREDQQAVSMWGKEETAEKGKLGEKAG